MADIVSPGVTATGASSGLGAITAIVEDGTSWRVIDDDTLDDLAGIVPNLDDLSDSGDPCLRW